MQLVINTYGSYLHIIQDSFELKVDGQKHRISPIKVESILITTGASLSTDAIKLALENNIEIQFLDRYGGSLGKIWHSRLGRTSYIRRLQLELIDKEQGISIIKELMIKKSENMINHLHKLGIRRSEEKQEYLEKCQNDIEKIIKKITKLQGKEIDDIRYSIMGYEGNISRIYFKALSHIMPHEYRFKGRSSRPAEDEFNCLLNYGYGVLYSKVEKALMIAGLDPYVGILHTDGYNKKSFVFDFIEPYRIYVDRVILKLFSKKQIRKSFFDDIKGGLTLNKEGKKILITELNNFFEDTIRYDGRDIKRDNVIQYDAHKLANKILEDDELC